MASTPPTLYTNSYSKTHPNEEYSTPIVRPTSRPASSFSSSSDSSFGSSSFSYIEEFSPFSPSTPLMKFKGVPFSWEQIPGIPKKQSSKKKESSHYLLPLPPAKKRHNQEEISPKKYHQRDPFFVALMECSKDDKCISKNITRSLSDRFGFISMYTSCKSTCVVSESMVYLPRSNPHSFLNRRSR